LKKFRYRQSVENNPKFLGQLIDLAFEQFKISAKHYRQFIDYASRQNNFRYQSNAIWTCIQNVLIQLLEEYLDIRHLGSSYSLNNNDLDKMDINSFFVRKRLINLGFGNDAASAANTRQNDAAGQTNTLSNQNTANTETVGSLSSHIFSFKNSSHAISITKYNREKNNENLFDDPESFLADNDEVSVAVNKSLNNEQRVFKILVCQPDHRNITTIFSLMEHIIKDVADEVRNVPNNMGASADQQAPSHIGKKLFL